MYTKGARKGLLLREGLRYFFFAFLLISILGGLVHLS
jgi:hypothetical protein